MPEVTITLAVSSFVAGVLMFLAPCTLPLVPAYLAFISGVDPNEVSSRSAKSKITLSAIAFVLGFTIIFTVFGMLAGFFGTFIGPLRGIMTKMGGVFIILFGLLMLNVINLAPLSKEHKISLPKFIVPGHPLGSFLMGSIFALGWTPCVGPVLASVLLLATTASTMVSGGLLLLVFSAGLAVPFIATAFLYVGASNLIAKYSYIASWINIIGGVFLIFIGLLLLTDNFGLIAEYGYQVFNYLGFDSLFEHY